MTFKGRHGTYENCHLYFRGFYMDDSPAIDVCNAEGRIVCHLTICLCRGYLARYESFVLANDNYALDFIREYQLGEKTERKVQIGCDTYTTVIFDIDQVRKYSEV